MQLLVPATTSLLEAVESLAKAPHPLWRLLLKPLWLLHVHLVLLLQFSVEVGVGDVHRFDVVAIECGLGKDCPEGSEASSGSEDLIEVDTRTLTESLGDETGLVLVDGAICVAFDEEDPTRSNGLASFR